ncbi:MAG: DUF262 domain-containing protein [SAR202 cluster bacterium]|nr:DUF262 domain-containing protein [SAR202 cluster bacterium]
MKMARDEFKVADLLDLRRNEMLRANPEYQRGEVWSGTQQKKLIDSVMRGYPLPLIYLHHIQKTVAGMQREDFEIIDGQQRINALYYFAEGAYKLLDPILDDREARFPNFLKTQPCPWGQKDFQQLPADMQNRFLSTSLAVVKITTDDENEARDLFIRLQAGLALNAQETRDAWPGQITDFVLRVGGKPKVARYPGHGFFQRVLGMKPGQDRGNTRKLAAQLLMLFLSRRNNANQYVDINRNAIDDFYYRNLDFDTENQDVKRFLAILDKLEQLLGGQKRPRLVGHDAIHMVLLLDSLWDNYTRSWESTLPGALDSFRHDLVLAKGTRYELQPSEYWTRYGQWTTTRTDNSDSIARRHAFYVEKMLALLGPLQKKDPKRLFGDLERELIYYRDKKLCAVCKADVVWNESEIHHVEGHAEGGPTTVDNGVLVHIACHPKGFAATAFSAQFRPKATEQATVDTVIRVKANRTRFATLTAPDGTVHQAPMKNATQNDVPAMEHLTGLVFINPNTGTGLSTLAKQKLLDAADWKYTLA